MKILKPTAGNIVALKVERSTTTPGGIVIPDSAPSDERMVEMVVVSVGDRIGEGEGEPPPCKAGDHILAWMDEVFTLEGKTFQLVGFHSVRAIIVEG